MKKEITLLPVPPVGGFRRAVLVLMVFEAALIRFGPFVWADESAKAAEATAAPATWPMLEQQSKDLAAEVQARDIPSMHKLDHAVAAETAALRKNAPPLPADQAQKLDALLVDIAKQASRAHHDGHAAKWDDAVAAQQQFAADLQAAKAILAGKSG